MFEFKGRRIIPNWYKLIENKKTKYRYKIYIIIFLIIDLTLCLILAKEIDKYLNTKDNTIKIDKVQHKNKFQELENDLLKHVDFTKNLKELNLVENRIRLTFVFYSMEEGNETMKCLNNNDANIRMTMDNGKYVYYVDI